MSPAPASPVGSPAPVRVRNAYIDTLRGWSIFGVVCVHFGGSFVNSGNAWSPSFYLGLSLNQLFSFAVPLFVFLSGYLAGGSQTKLSLWGYYHSRFWRIGFPYLVASAFAFFLLNHYHTWSLLGTAQEQWSWLLQKILFYGVEPTLYFIPLIILLYVVQPVLKALPGWLHCLVPGRLKTRLRLEHVVLLLSALLLALHITLGVLCFRSTLSYYDWARPNPLFWAFYFFTGLHFRSLLVFATKRLCVSLLGLGLIVAAVAMFMNGLYLTDHTLVGALFEHSNIDFAYVRPQIMVFDLAMVLCLSTGIALHWNWQPGIASFLGRYTLEIYLWHILVLYYGAWRYAEVLTSCREIPELIIIVCAATCFIIAGVAWGIPRLFHSLSRYRLRIVQVD